MKLNTAQKSWIAYDMGNAAFALIVRTAFAAILFKYCADEVWGKDNTTACWGYVCSLSGIAAGALSITLGYYADRYHWKKLLLALFVIVGVTSTGAFAFV